MKNTRLLFLIAIAGVFGLGGCTVGPEYEEPELATVPDAWHTAVTDGVLEGDAPIQTWWTVFDDDTLSSLIERAGASNLTLREAVWRVEEARSLRGVVAGARVPQVTLDGSANRSRAVGQRTPRRAGSGRLRRRQSLSISGSAPAGSSMSGAGSAARSKRPTPRSRPRWRTTAMSW